MPSKQGPRVWARITNLQHPRFSLHDLLASHPINHAVQLLIPGSNQEIIEQLGDAAPDLNLHNNSCMVSGPLGDIIHDLIAQQAWHHDDGSGQRTAQRPVGVAIGPCMATTGGIALTGDGVLHLSINQSTYQQLGLTGRRSLMQEGGRHQIAVQLTSKECQPGQPYHDRVVNRLNQVIGHSCLALSIPIKPQTSESQQPHISEPQQSVATPTATLDSFSALLPSILSSNVQLLKTQVDSWTVSDVTLPRMTRAALLEMDTFDNGSQQHNLQSSDAEVKQGAGVHIEDSMQVDEVQKTGSTEGSAEQKKATSVADNILEQLLQWIGALCCRVPGPAIDTVYPVESTSNGKGCVHARQWSGLIHSDAVLQTALYASQLVQSGKAPWAAVCMWGWEDSPVGWQGMEHCTGHTVGLAGEGTSHGVLLFLPNDDVLILRALTNADVTVPVGGQSR